MVRINIRVDGDTEELITFLASNQGVSKSMMARTILLEGINNVLFPVVARLFKEGKIGLKHVVKLTKMGVLEVLERLSTHLDDAPITGDIDEYTSEIASKFMARLQST